MSRLSNFLFLLGISACATAEGPSGQGGAEFRAVKAEALPPMEPLLGVCWPADSGSPQKVTLTFTGKDIIFETTGGATNSTGRCMREIAAAYPTPSTPMMALLPPATPVGGWVVLAWVKLLSPGRYGPERGVLDPAPLVSACLARGGPIRDSTRFEVAPSQGAGVKTIPYALTDSERCIEAVLGSTAWPSSREFSLNFSGPNAVAPSGDVSLYVAPKESASGVLDPAAVHDAVRSRQGAVAICWNRALTRHVGLGGGRTFRFRVAAGKVTAAWVAGNVSQTNETAADFMLDGCLGEVLKATPFEGSGDGVYTWVFATRG